MSDTRVPMFTLGDRLAKARETAGISVQAMADRLGVARNTIGNWEHDRVEATRAAKIAYSTLTGVPLWWIEGTTPGEDAIDRRATRSTKWQATAIVPWRGELPVTIPLKIAA